MATREKAVLFSERMERPDVPFLPTLMWTGILTLGGLVALNLGPDRNPWLYVGVPAATGLGVGLAAEFSSGTLSAVLRFPMRIVTYAIVLAGGGLAPR